MDVNTIISIVAACVLFVLNVLQFVFNKLGKTKAAGVAGSVADLVGDVQAAMIKAEALGVPGEYKKNYVKSTIMLLCNSIGIKYDDSTVDDMIENFIELSKKINNKGDEKSNVAE